MAEEKENMKEEARANIELVEDREEKDLMHKIEAALFLSAKFMSIQEITMLTGINPLTVKEILNKIKEKHEVDSGALALISKNDNKLWKMDVKPKYSGMISKLASGSAEFSRAEQETLAVIAYKQPIKQSVVVKVRGNKAYDHIKNFISLGLVRGKKQGHTLLLSLSDDFYNYFQLSKKPSEKEKEENNQE